MRTTVTIDPDVEAMLERRMREKGIRFKEALNSALRAGLMMSGGPKRMALPEAVSMKLRSGVTLNRALQLAAQMEDEEIVRKLDIKK